MTFESLGTEPIQEDCPAGKDAREDPAFDELQSEVQKAASVIHGPAADWEKIVNLSSGILAMKSKDILVAGYLAVGLIHTRGFEGFLIGSGVYVDLIRNYWDDLFPAKTRETGRSRAITWWIEKTTAVLQTLDPVSVSGQQAEVLVSRLEALQLFLNSHLKDGASLGPIFDWIKIASSPSESQAALPSFAALQMRSSEDPLAHSPLAAAPSEIVSEKQVHQTLERIAEQARAIASFGSSKDRADPMIYRLNRMSLWIGVSELPPASEGRTLLTSPERHLVDHLQSLGTHGDFEAWLSAAEETAFQFIFWLDLHRFSAEALNAMGERFAKAAETVCRETASFVGRMGGIEALAFKDGRPFADPDTIRWLRQSAPAPLMESAAMPASAASAADGTIPAIEEIKRLLRARKIQEAALHFQTWLRTALPAREKFLGRLEFVDLLTTGASGILLVPQIDHLLGDIDKYRLDEYDPSLALRGLTIALKACRARTGAAFDNKAQELMHRLAKIDMAEYFRQGG